MSGRPLEGVQACIIDLDGTMLDTAGDFHAAVNAMLVELTQRHGLACSALPREQIVSFVGKGSENLIRRVLDASVPPAAANSLFAEALTLYNGHYIAINGQHVTMYPEVREGLNALQSAGLRLACVTNKPHAFTVPLLERKGLAPYFEVVYCGDTFPFRKPDPYPMLQVSTAFNISPEHFVAIGDSENDAQAARAAGMRVLTVPYGYNHGQAIQSVDSDGIVSSLLEAARRIGAAPAHSET
jgi:phosphoglycolate phosphatase